MKKKKVIKVYVGTKAYDDCDQRTDTAARRIADLCDGVTVHDAYGYGKDKDGNTEVEKVKVFVVGADAEHQEGAVAVIKEVFDKERELGIEKDGTFTCQRGNMQFVTFGRCTQYGNKHYQLYKQVAGGQKADFWIVIEEAWYRYQQQSEVFKKLYRKLYRKSEFTPAFDKWLKMAGPPVSRLSRNGKMPHKNNGLCRIAALEFLVQTGKDFFCTVRADIGVDLPR